MPRSWLFSAPDGYASVAMVDISYLGFRGERGEIIAEMPLVERAALLYAPYLPFDGMNEHGLVVGMAAVSPSPMPVDPDHETLGSLEIMREVLDHARTVDEATVPSAAPISIWAARRSTI
jgi:hypothetical protein